MASGWLICAATRFELEAAWRAWVPNEALGLAGLTQTVSGEPSAQSSPWVSPRGCEAKGPWFLVCGAGMPQATLTLIDALHRLQPQAVLQVGLAGAFDGCHPPLAVGDLVGISHEYLGDLGLEWPGDGANAQSDFRPLHLESWADAQACGPWGLAPWPDEALQLAPGLRRVIGLTVNRVTGTEATAAARYKLFEAMARVRAQDVAKSGSLNNALADNPLVETMEGAALAMACAHARVPGYALRAISNRVGKRNMVPEQFQRALQALQVGLKAMQPFFAAPVGGGKPAVASASTSASATTSALTDARRTHALRSRSAPMRMTLALSPCPNDVFLYGGLLAGEVGVPGVEFDFIFEDIEALNQRATQGGGDLIKISFANLPRCVGAYRLLRCGGALGHGCGPLLLTGGAPFDVTREILLPGEATTAHALFNAYANEGWPEVTLRKRFMRFDEIYAALRKDPEVQGVVIHEMRFTYARDGLHLVQDLGAFWEASTGGPIPLGALVQRRDSILPSGVVEAAVRQSLAWSRKHEVRALELCRKHAQSMDDAVMRSHIDLYVNAFSHDLGEMGEKAVAVFLARCGFEQSPF